MPPLRIVSTPLTPATPLAVSVQQDARVATHPIGRRSNHRDLSTLGKRPLPAEEQTDRVGRGVVLNAEWDRMQERRNLLLDALGGNPVDLVVARVPRRGRIHRRAELNLEARQGRLAHHLVVFVELSRKQRLLADDRRRDRRRGGARARRRRGCSGRDRSRRLRRLGHLLEEPRVAVRHAVERIGMPGLAREQRRCVSRHGLPGLVRANRQRIVQSRSCFFRHRITAMNVWGNRQRPRGLGVG